MEVAIGSNNSTPFQREIREWQRIDPNTGALLTGRLEADRWINGPLNAYGKVVDSQNVSQPNGTKQTQRKQLEVLQAHTSSGSMQVIRAQTVQTTSSRWSSSTTSAATSFNSTTSALGSVSSSSSSVATQNNKLKSLTSAHANTTHTQIVENEFNNNKKNNKFKSNDTLYNNNGGINGSDHHNNQIHHDSNHNLFKKQQQQQQQYYQQHQQKPSNLSYNLQQTMMLMNDQTTTPSSTINGHDHHLNNHNNNNNNSNDHHNNNNCGGNSSSTIINNNTNNNQHGTTTASEIISSKTEPSLKLSNLMKSSQSNNSDRSSPHSFSSINKNSMNNFSTTSATAAKIIKTKQNNIKNKSSMSIVQKVHQQQQQQQKQHLQQQQNQFENGITSPLSTSTVSSSSSSSPSSSSSSSSSSTSLLSSSTASASATVSINSFNNSNSRTIQQNSHHFKLKEKQQKQQQQPTLVDSNSNSNCVGVGGIIEVGGFEHNNNSSSLIPNGEEITMHQHEKYSDFNFQRSRSASIDDLSTEWDESNQTATDESSEWRRVSKIRRSFQFPKTNSPPKHSPTIVLRPADLPENCVSVARIRQELEKGRRLNAAMCNNNVDLVAMDHILNGLSNNSSVTEQNEQQSPKSVKKSPAFLTAESLKEIRGKLKKLSDESLYKDDFIINQTINNSDIKTSTEIHDQQSSAPVRLNDLNEPLSSQMIRHQKSFQYLPKTASPQLNHTTNSLENRTTRLKDTTSAEWHLRRKSYGFEKMSPPDSKMLRMENSTDSGLGRSSDLGNLSPTETRATVINFSETAGTVNGTNKNATTVVLNGDNGYTQPIVHRRYRDSNKINLLSLDKSPEVKRHSIAVDETKYVRENLRKVFDGPNSVETVTSHLNRLYLKEDNGSTSISLDETQRINQRKRVEFCKTEVHFAAESGRVNIVETDGKPPPSNNFRRRRRSSGNAYIDAITSGLQVTHFGDENRSTNDNGEDLDQNKNESSNLIAEKNSVTVSIPSVPIEMDATQAITNCYLGPDDNDDQDEISLRGILKNKPMKPKPYHLGENIGSNDRLWGVKLKPIIGNGTVETKVSPSIRVFEEESLDTSEKTSNLKSVADHVRIVEERKDVNGYYSTKINLNLTDKPFTWNSAAAGQNEGDIKKPIAIPRKKTTGTTRPLSMGNLNNNSQLRRIFETGNGSDIESDDSVQAADEEVKRYLSNELLDQLDEQENSNQVVADGWNRVKAEKSSLKSEKINIEDIPKSNVMSIQLQSPQSSRKIFTNIHEPSKNIQAPVPIAKPRTSIQLSPSNIENSKIYKKPIKLSPIPTEQTPSTTKLSLGTLKIEPNGARKLREHELSYFGVKISPEDDTMNRATFTNNTKPRKQSPHSSNNEINRKLQNNPKIIEETTNSSTKWKLSCDKPDLLRHSPMNGTQNNVPLIVSLKDQEPNQITRRSNEALMHDDEDLEDNEDEDEMGPIYENLKLPYPYNRKDDLIRDEMILSEMTKAADQTMKTVSDAHKVQKRREKRRSEQRHQSQPLDTIAEKLSPSLRSNNHNEFEKSYLQQTENSQRRSSLSRRSSSASSTGSFSDTGSLGGRSTRSKSKEKLIDSNRHSSKSKTTSKTIKEPVATQKTTPKTSKKSASLISPIAVSVRRAVEHRSSSQESQRSHKSSTENLQLEPPQKCERRHKRLTTSSTVEPSEKYHKDSTTTSLSRHRSERSSTESNDRHRVNKPSRNQTTTVPSDARHKTLHRSSRTLTNSDTIKHSQKLSSRPAKESSNGNHTTKMIRSSSRSSKEHRDSEGRSASEQRKTRNSHDRKEQSSERHSKSRALINEKEDHLRTSTRSDRINRTTCPDELRSSKRSHKLEDSDKNIRSKDKSSSSDRDHHKTSQSSNVNSKTSIQHGTKTATIPAIMSSSSSSATKGLHHHGTTYVSEQPVVTRLIPPPRKKRLKNNNNSNNSNSNNNNSNNNSKNNSIKYQNQTIKHDCSNKKLSKNLSPQYTNSTTSSFVFYPSSSTVKNNSIATSATASSSLKKLKKNKSFSRAVTPMTNYLKYKKHYDRPLLNSSPDDFLDFNKTTINDDDDDDDGDDDKINNTKNDDYSVINDDDGDSKYKKFHKELFNNLEQMKIKRNFSLNTKNSDIIDYYFKTKRNRDGKAQYIMVQNKQHYHHQQNHNQKQQKQLLQQQQQQQQQQRRRLSQCGICTCS